MPSAGMSKVAVAGATAVAKLKEYTSVDLELPMATPSAPSTLLLSVSW